MAKYDIKTGKLVMKTKKKKESLTSTGKKEKEKLPPNMALWFAFEKDKSSGKAEAIQMVVDYFLDKYNFLTLGGATKDEVYFYKGGIYVPDAHVLIKKEMEEMLVENSKTTYVNEVINKIARNTYINRSEFEEPLNKICLKNNILNIDTFEIEEFSPEIIFLNKLPVVYNPKTDCPKIKRFIREVILPKEEWDNEESDTTDLLTLQEFCGYLLYKKIIFNRAVMLYGEGENGKSTFINLIKKFLGNKNVANVPIQKLETNTFAAASLLGKLANLHADLPKVALKETSRFKQLTGGDAIDAEKKFKDNFSYTPYAKMIFAANKLPETYDDTRAFWRRWLIFRFPNYFSEEEKSTNKNLLDELATEEELSGFLNWALEGLKRLLNNKGFTKNRSTEEIREEYIRQSDSIGAFILDMIEECPGNFIVKKDLYETYMDYCRDRGYDALAENSFHRKFHVKIKVREINPKVRGRQEKAWSGIRLRMTKRGENDNKLL